LTTADVSTPENTDKVITLITNKSDTNLFRNMITTFDIVGGADAERFTLKKGNKLTFKAKYEVLHRHQGSWLRLQ
jgi:hypothetical protein